MEYLPTDLPQYVKTTSRTELGNAVVAPDHYLLFSEDGQTLTKKLPDGSFVTVGGGATDFYKCATVDTANQTWTGYKAVFSGGVYSFESTATTGLTYTVVTPEVGKTYSGDALVIVENLWQGVPITGLIRYAPLSASAATDDLGNGLTTVQTVTFGTDSGIPCASFPDDDPGYIGYTSPVPTLTAWSMSIWVKAIADAGDAYVTLSDGNYGEGGGEIWLIAKPDGTVLVGNGAPSGSIIEITGITVGWHHYVIVWTGSVFRLYIDGTQQGSDASASYEAYDPYLYVNSLQRAPGAVRGHGKYAALRLYDRALTASEITALAGEFA